MRLSRTDLRMLVREELNRFKRSRLSESRRGRGGRRLNEMYGESMLVKHGPGRWDGTNRGSVHTFYTVLGTEDPQVDVVLEKLQESLEESGLPGSVEFMDWDGVNGDGFGFAVELHGGNHNSIELVRSFLADEHVGPMY